MSQMVSEYMRLESRLAGMAIGAEGADHDEVRLRLEIMMSQIELLQEGDLGKFISKSEQRKTVVATLIRNLHLLDKQVDTMTPEQVRQILPVLSELDGPLTSMAAATLTQDINIVHITHDKIQHLYYIYSVISILLIAMCITLGLLMLRQNNNLRRAHVRMKTLANDLQASKEKLHVQNRRLQYDAYHDSLTGMPNRLSFWQRLQEIVNQVRPYKGCAVVMLFDLDSFKDVNDTLGHDAGDKLLQIWPVASLFSAKPPRRCIALAVMSLRCSPTISLKRWPLSGPMLSGRRSASPIRSTMRRLISTPALGS